MEKRGNAFRPSEIPLARARQEYMVYTRWMEEERQLHPCAAVAVAVAETEPALVIYINPIIAWRFPN